MTAAARACVTAIAAIAATAALACAIVQATPSGSKPAQAPIAVSAVTGDLRLERLTSQIFGNTRTLRVLVPSGYDAPANQARRYPVLYLNDGQNLFDPATSTFSAGEWRVDETVGALVAAGRVPPLIVVGIDHAGRRERFHEYFPYPDAFLDPPDPDPQGRRYPAFLLDEVVPFVEARYRVESSPARRGLGGSSAGALAALYTALTRPGAFGRLLVESPSIYIDGARILKDAAPARTWPQRIFIGAGTAEGPPSQPCPPVGAPDPELVVDVKRLVATLRAAGLTDRRVRLAVTPCGRHSEDAWAARLPEALAFLYGDAPR